MCIISRFLNTCSIVLFYLWIQFWWERHYKVVWMKPWKCLLEVLKVKTWGTNWGCVQHCKPRWRSWRGFLASKWEVKILLLDFVAHEPAKFWTCTLLLSSWNTARSKRPEVRSHPIDLSIRTCLQSNLTSLLVEQSRRLNFYSQSPCTNDVAAELGC